MTGLWQVSGRSNKSYEERVSLDEHYVTTRSLRLDLQILIRTIPTVLFRAERAPAEIDKSSKACLAPIRMSVTPLPVLTLVIAS